MDNKSDELRRELKFFEAVERNIVHACENRGNVLAVRFKPSRTPDDVAAYEKWCMVEKEQGDSKELDVVHMFLNAKEATEVGLARPDSVYEVVGVANEFTDILGVPSDESDYADDYSVLSKDEAENAASEWHLNNLGHNRNKTDDEIAKLHRSAEFYKAKKEQTGLVYVKNISKELILRN